MHALALAAVLAAAPDPRAAVEAGLRRLEAGAAAYTERKTCYSCHHQGTAITVLAEAKSRGLRVAEGAVERQVRFTLDYFRARLKEVRAGRGVGGGNTMAASALDALAAAGHPADDVTEALAVYLVTRQAADGSWPAVTARRRPTEGSPFTNAAAARRGLRHYRDGLPEELRCQVEAALVRNAAWLADATPADTEDRTARLRALIDGGGERAAVDAARDDLLGRQRADGGWAQADGRESDAYATATVLLSLTAAGVRPNAAAYRRGIDWLLAARRDDGAWVVATRAEPVQVFFDNGDPGGKSQFLSFTTTGWATLALMTAAGP
jgi:hypothetical protein